MYRSRSPTSSLYEFMGDKDRCRNLGLFAPPWTPGTENRLTLFIESSLDPPTGPETTMVICDMCGYSTSKESHVHSA